MRFYIIIWDINNNAPVFVDAPYIVNISEVKFFLNIKFSHMLFKNIELRPKLGKYGNSHKFYSVIIVIRRRSRRRRRKFIGRTVTNHESEARVVARWPDGVC